MLVLSAIVSNTRLVDKNGKNRGGTINRLVPTHGDTVARAQARAQARALASPGPPRLPLLYKGTLPLVRFATKKTTRWWETRKNKRRENF